MACHSAPASCHMVATHVSPLSVSRASRLERARAGALGRRGAGAIYQISKGKNSLRRRVMITRHYKTHSIVESRDLKSSLKAA